MLQVNLDTLISNLVTFTVFFSYLANTACFSYWRYACKYAASTSLSVYMFGGQLYTYITMVTRIKKSNYLYKIYSKNGKLQNIIWCSVSSVARIFGTDLHPNIYYSLFNMFFNKSKISFLVVSQVRNTYPLKELQTQTILFKTDFYPKN